MCVCVCVHGHFQVYNLRIISQKMSTRFLRFSEWANDIRVEVYRKIPENFQRLLENFWGNTFDSFINSLKYWMTSIPSQGQGDASFPTFKELEQNTDLWFTPIELYGGKNL